MREQMKYGYGNGIFPPPFVMTALLFRQKGILKRGQIAGDGILQRQPSALPADQHGGGSDRLRHRSEAEHALWRERDLFFQIRITAADLEHGRTGEINRRACAGDFTLTHHARKIFFYFLKVIHGFLLTIFSFYYTVNRQIKSKPLGKQKEFRPKKRAEFPFHRR